MAHWQRLTRFADIGLVGAFAERFGRDPDKVFWKTSFATVIAFAEEVKERREYRERVNFIWGEINKGVTHDNAGSNNRGE